MRTLIILAALLIIFLSPTCYGQGTFTAATCNYADVNGLINNTGGSQQHLAVNGDIIIIPAGTCSWTLTLTINVAITLQGAGAISSTSWNGTTTSTTGTDQTTITENENGKATIILNTTLGNPEMRITGIAFIQPTGVKTTTGQLGINGTATNVRIDHCHFFSVSGDKAITINGSVLGVADHMFFDAPVAVTFDVAFYNGAGWNGQSDPNAYGDPSWADGNNFGTSKFFYVEDSYFNGGGSGDCYQGGRGVVRYSTYVNNGGGFGHGTSSGGGRSCRAEEFYNLNFSYSPSHAGAIGHLNGGEMLAWGITASGVNNVIGIAMERILQNEGLNTAETPPTPTSWGLCGTKYGVGTATTTATSTAVTGTGFDTTWPTPFAMWIPGAQCPNFNYPTVIGSSCGVSSVAGSTSLTLSRAAGATVTGVTATVGSPWDGGATTHGYPCMDSPGRGKGDLLNGLNFPSRLDTVTSTITWPNQLLSPVYSWANTYTPPGTGGQGIVVDSSGTLAANRDFFQQYGTYGQAGSNCTGSPCNITVGVNQTTRDPVNGTDTCTGNTDPKTSAAAPGVGWWNSTNSKLWVCNPTNTWTVYYTPFTYPHPLTGTPSFTVSPSTIPANHSGNLTISLTGTNTAWTSGTTFSISTLSGVSLISQTVNAGAQTGTITVRTGATTGSFNVSDSTDSAIAIVTVSTATLVVSPTSGATGTVVAIVLNGTNTLWSSETASTLFSVSGGTGASLATPTINSNVSASVNLTVGSSAGTLTITDNSTTATTTFTANATVNIPTVTTTVATSITATGAQTGGTVTSNGGGTITAEGVACGTSPNPTSGSSCSVASGGTTPSFTITLSGLTAGVTYHYRSYATNSAGTGFGSDLTFTTLSTTTCASPVPVGIYTVCNAAYNDVNATTVTVSFTPSVVNAMQIWGSWGGSSPLTQTATVGDNINNPEPCFQLSPNSPFSLSNPTVPDYEIFYAWVSPDGCLPSGITSFSVTTSATAQSLQIDAVEWKAGTIALTNFFDLGVSGTGADKSTTSGNTASTSARVSTNGVTANTNVLLTSLIITCGGSYPGIVGTGYTGILVNPLGTLGHIVQARSTTYADVWPATMTWLTGTPFNNCSLGNGVPFDTWLAAIVPLVGANQPPPNAPCPGCSASVEPVVTVKSGVEVNK